MSIARYLTKLGALLNSDGKVPPSGMSLTTPSQFANDTSPATAAFVQRALGNYQTAINISANQTLTAADAGKVICGGGPAKTITMPLLSTVPDGTMFEFILQGPTTFATQGSDGLYMNGYGFFNPYTAAGGNSLLIIKMEGVWYIANGTAMLGYGGSTGASIAGNGWQKIGRTIIQWGTYSQNNGTDMTITFPIAFPNNLTFVVPAQNTRAAGADQYFCGIGALNPSLSGFTSQDRTDSSPNTFRYLAVGY